MLNYTFPIHGNSKHRFGCELLSSFQLIRGEHLAHICMKFHELISTGSVIMKPLYVHCITFLTLFTAVFLRPQLSCCQYYPTNEKLPVIEP